MFRSFSFHARNDYSGNSVGDYLVRLWRIQLSWLDSFGISLDLLRLPRRICPP